MFKEAATPAKPAVAAAPAITPRTETKPMAVRPPRGPATAAAPPRRKLPPRSTTGRPGPFDAPLDDEVDALFDGVTLPAGATAAGPGTVRRSVQTEAEIRKLFGEIAAHHCAQLRDFLAELTLSPTSKQWIEICSPALASMRRAADGIEHDPLTRALDKLQKALDDAKRGPATLITDAPRTKLLAMFGGLTKVLPEAFDLKELRSRREPIIINTLLSQVPGMSTLSIERIYGAGLSSLKAFYGARGEDIAAATGVSLEVSVAVAEQFVGYRSSRAERAEHAGYADERKRIAALLEQVRESQAAFREAEEQERSRDKRRLRSLRSELLQRINLALAHLGQVDLVTEIDKIPVDQKIKRIAGFLSSSSGAH